MRRVRLGAPADEHEYKAAQGLKRAHAALVRAGKLQGSAKRCDQIWDQLLSSQANLSFAYAHLESYKPRQKTMNAFYTLQNRQARLRETLGFQCTRKK